MGIRISAFVAAGAVATIALTACSSSGNSNSGNSSSAGSKTGSSSGKVQVGVILPDTTSSTRYTLYDAPLLKKAFDAAGVKSDIQNSGGSTSKQAQIADSMIGEGIKVMLIDSIDATSGAAIEKKADAAGIQVIDYDRVNLGGTAKLYVSHDSEGVGKQQAETLVKCLDAEGKKNPQIIEMDGGKDVDNNAVLFAKGADSVFTPLQSQGKLKVVSKTTVPGWDKNKAAGLFQQALTANGGKVDAVYAANDDIANEIITVLNNKGLKVPVTGQDAGINGLQNILKGTQCVTVFKDVSNEVDVASKLAVALIKGQDPSTVGDLKPFDDPKLPSHKIQALLVPTEPITKANVKVVVDAGALKVADICKGIEQQCKAAGLQ